MAELGYASDTQSSGARGGDPDCIRVVEAERFGRAYPVSLERVREPGPGFRVGRWPSRSGLCAKDLVQQCAGILGIDIDRAVEQGIPDQPRTPEPGSMLH